MVSPCVYAQSRGQNFAILCKKNRFKHPERARMESRKEHLEEFPVMSVLLEKLRLIRENKHLFRVIPIGLTVGLLLYYCVHPAMYSADQDRSLLLSVRTYEIALLSAALIFLWLVENTLSDRANRILSWIWFALAPFAVYFSLLFLNKDKYNINFFALDKITLLLTFVFLYLVQGILYGLTGSIRFSVIIYAVAVATLGIVNCFVISFRGMALSAADLFSISTAAAVASEYTYTLDWYMVMEILFTLLICTVSLKLRKGRMMPLAARGVFLALVAVMAGGYYYLCGKTSFLEDHDIRSEGFTHQLRYKNMICSLRRSPPVFIWSLISRTVTRLKRYGRSLPGTWIRMIPRLKMEAQMMAAQPKMETQVRAAQPKL